MNDFVQMHIFFFVTTIAVVIVGVLLAIILFRIYQILSHVEDISREISEESTLVRADIADLRSNVRNQGFKMKFLSSFFRSTLGRFARTRTRTRKKE
jgi:hypothetical protein